MVLLELFVLVPFGAFVGNRYPDWSVMYLMDTRELSTASWAMGLSLHPILAITAFFVCRRLLLKNKPKAVWGLLGGAALVLVVVAYLMQDAVLAVGPHSAFVSKGPTLRPLAETQLVYFVAVGAVALMLSWGMSLWRLRLVSTATERRPTKRTAKRPPSPGPRTQPLRKKKSS